MKGLRNRVAVITGGAQGIGKGIAKRLLEEGMRVALFDIDAEALEETVRELGGMPDVIGLCGDVAAEYDVRRAMGATATRLGRIDALVNNAGIAKAESGPIESLDLADWNRWITVNLTGAMLCTKHAVPHLRSGQKTNAAIVNIASTRAFQSEPHCEAYAASKGGLVALTHALAASLGPKIRVNCICPGWINVAPWAKAEIRSQPEFREIDHAQHWVGRIGEPPDIAALAAFLLSEEATFISGQSFVCDGGMTKKMIYAP